MNFHIHIKFRAFGITFGSLDQVVSGAATVQAVLNVVLPIVVKAVPAAALIDPSSLVSQIHVAPHVIYNNNGVLVEVVSA